MLPAAGRTSAFCVALAVALPACSSHPSTPDASPDASVDDVVADAAVDAVTPSDIVMTGAPRQLAPLSTAAVTAHRPTLYFVLPEGATGAQIDVCRARDCATVEQTLGATGNSATPTADLAPGVHYWRLRVAGMNSPVWEFFVGQRSASRDTSWGTVADPDGDGLADVLIGASHANQEAGKVYVYRGTAGGLGATPSATLSHSSDATGHFGWAVSSAGDVNGDGYGDVVVGAPDSGAGGAAFVFFGGASGVDGAPSQSLASPASLAGFGSAVAGVGDVNGDGYGDVVVGAPNAVSTTGAVYLYFGSASGLVTTPAMMISGSDGPSGTFGTTLAAAGDVNGDGLGDVVIGAPGARNTFGRAYVYVGSHQGFDPTGVLLESPSMEAGQFGNAVSGAGDVNGDGFADVMIGASGTTNGDVWVYQGGASGLGTTPASAVTGPDGIRGGFGWTVTAAGDVNGDGFGDVAIGAVCAPFGADPDGGYPTCGPGMTYVYQGGQGGLSVDHPAVSLRGPTGGEPASFGWSLGGGGDLDGDGYGDVVVGAAAAANFAGTVMVFRGGTGGISTTPLATMQGPDGAGGNFGWAVSL